MFLIAAVVVFLLDGFNAIDSTENVDYLPLSLALGFAHFLFNHLLPPLPWDRRR